MTYYHVFFCLYFIQPEQGSELIPEMEVEFSNLQLYDSFRQKHDYLE